MNSPFSTASWRTDIASDSGEYHIALPATAAPTPIVAVVRRDGQRSLHLIGRQVARSGPSILYENKAPLCPDFFQEQETFQPTLHQGFLIVPPDYAPLDAADTLACRTNTNLPNLPRWARIQAMVTKPPALHRPLLTIYPAVRLDDCPICRTNLIPIDQPCCPRCERTLREQNRSLKS